MMNPAHTPEGAHPLAATIARLVWLLPLLPFLGFLINGALAIFGAAKIGPADPSADHGHGHDEAHGHDAAHGHADHGHDHVHPPRHKFASIVSLVGPGVLVVTFLLASAIFVAMRGVAMEHPYVLTLFSWMPVGDLNLDATILLDPLSMTMVMVVSGVGMLIHIFSVGYMQDDPGYPRYFAYLNLFVFFMLLLVLGGSYPLLFVGWEGVGLCSYLLIGFWFSEKANADAGKKAFLVNRIGDFGFLVAMFLMFANLGTLDILGVAEKAKDLPMGGIIATAIALFLFLGCTGKSAQIPLYVWLPDAMAGPTPVSALIHAATMVTAGVYLVARASGIFSMAPVAQLTVAAVGALTAFFAATIGLKQWDIKKVLAYSTVSQLGYMFVGVGVGAYTAGIFHLATHAFFKALLFLGSGSVIFAMHRAYHATHNHDDAQDMRNMGGLRQYMPVTFALMWIATLAIAGIPLFSGFFSKDEILSSVFARVHHSTLAESSLLGIPGGTVLLMVYGLGLASALLTAIYMTRMMLYTFHGPNRTGEQERPHLKEAPWIMTGPLVVLGVLAAFGGWLNVPALLGAIGPVGGLEHFLEPVVGENALRTTLGQPAHMEHSTELALVGVAILIAVAGIAFAVWRLKPAALVAKKDAAAAEGIERVLENKYFVDEGYDAAIVQPTVNVSRAVLWKGFDAGVIDGLFVNGSALLARAFGWVGSQLQSGQVGTYAWVLLIGVITLLGAFTFR
ncbi:MAG: NADH-quinone oxidoreductase subunit L [Gemmatimonadaceae bacterium]|nr:NADH-quinone oxidoreductase subunit L [Gemmatimonadaceae bacterium]